MSTATIMNPRSRKAAVPQEERYLTPSQVASKLCVTVDTVILWCKRCDLRSVDVSRNQGRGKRFFAIRPEDLDDFIEKRFNQPPLKRERKKRRQRCDDYERTFPE